MQFTTNIKDRHQGGEFGWVFDNIHQIINDKVGDNETPIRCLNKFRIWGKQDFKKTYSCLRKSKRILDNSGQGYVANVTLNFFVL